MHRHSLALVILLALGFLPSAVAQESKSAPAPGENGRFTFAPVADGQLRLDTRTGQVSLCHSRQGIWTCETVADDRAAYEKEIARLQNKIGDLEALARRSAGEIPPKSEPKFPNDAEIDRAMNFFEKVLRRFRGMIENLSRETDRNRS
ncbi:MAG: hypothetical protein Q7S17_06715 [Xanthobacteraceae bacterium]|nr:hypothetical protein [Xanthobacteraceae bacterium]